MRTYVIASLFLVETGNINSKKVVGNLTELPSLRWMDGWTDKQWMDGREITYV